MPDSLLIIDASPLIYAVYDTQGHLCTSEGDPTGLRYGFLRSVRSYKTRTKCNKVAICYDMPGQVKKAVQFTDYKANREMTEDKRKMYSQVPALKEMISFTHWTQLQAEGFEADDIVGNLALTKAARGMRVVYVSPDNDLAQTLCHPRISRFIPGKKGGKDRYYTPEDVKSDFGVWPEHLLVWRAIVGDRSDNLSGIGLAKPKEALIKEFLNTLPRQVLGFHDALAALKAAGFVTEDFDETKFEQNCVVMSLPFPDDLKVTPGKKDEKELTRLFRNLQFKSMMKHIPELTGK